MQAVEAVAQQDGVLAACKALCGTWWDLWSQAHGALGICCLVSGPDDAVHVLRGHAAVGTLVAAPEPGPLLLEVRAEADWLPVWGEQPLHGLCCSWAAEAAAHWHAEQAALCCWGVYLGAEAELRNQRHHSLRQGCKCAALSDLEFWGCSRIYWSEAWAQGSSTFGCGSLCCC